MSTKKTCHSSLLHIFFGHFFRSLVSVLPPSTCVLCRNSIELTSPRPANERKSPMRPKSKVFFCYLIFNEHYGYSSFGFIMDTNDGGTFLYFAYKIKFTQIRLGFKFFILLQRINLLIFLRYIFI